MVMDRKHRIVFYLLLVTNMVTALYTMPKDRLGRLWSTGEEMKTTNSCEPPPEMPELCAVPFSCNCCLNILNMTTSQNGGRLTPEDLDSAMALLSSYFSCSESLTTPYDELQLLENNLQTIFMNFQDLSPDVEPLFYSSSSKFLKVLLDGIRKFHQSWPESNFHLTGTSTSMFAHLVTLKSSCNAFTVQTEISISTISETVISNKCRVITNICLQTNGTKLAQGCQVWQGIRDLSQVSSKETSDIFLISIAFLSWSLPFPVIFDSHKASIQTNGVKMLGSIGLFTSFDNETVSSSFGSAESVKITVPGTVLQPYRRQFAERYNSNFLKDLPIYRCFILDTALEAWSDAESGCSSELKTYNDSAIYPDLICSCKKTGLIAIGVILETPVVLQSSPSSSEITDVPDLSGETMITSTPSETASSQFPVNAQCGSQNLPKICGSPLSCNCCLDMMTYWLTANFTPTNLQWAALSLSSYFDNCQRWHLEADQNESLEKGLQTVFANFKTQYYFPADEHLYYNESAWFLDVLIKGMRKFNKLWTFSDIHMNNSSQKTIFVHKVSSEMSCDSFSDQTETGITFSANSGGMLSTRCEEESDRTVCLHPNNTSLGTNCQNWQTGYDLTMLSSDRPDVYLITLATDVRFPPLRVHSADLSVRKDKVALSTWTVGLFTPFDNMNDSVITFGQPSASSLITITIPWRIQPEVTVPFSGSYSLQYRCLIMDTGLQEWTDSACVTHPHQHNNAVVCSCNKLGLFTLAAVADASLKTTTPHTSPALVSSTQEVTTASTTDSESSSTSASAFEETTTIPDILPVNTSFATLGLGFSPSTQLSTSRDSTVSYWSVTNFSTAASTTEVQVLPGVSPVLLSLAANVTCENGSAEWTLSVPDQIVQAIADLNSANAKIQFLNVELIARIIGTVLECNFTGQTGSVITPAKVNQTLISIIGIYDALVTLDLEHKLDKPSSLESGNAIASALYQALEKLEHFFSMFLLHLNSDVHVLSYGNHISISLRSVCVFPRSKFDDFRFLNSVSVVDIGKLNTTFLQLPPAHDLSAISEADVSLLLNETYLRAEFEKKKKLPFTCNIFSISLMALRRFRFSHFNPRSFPEHLPVRQARKVAGILLVSALREKIDNMPSLVSTKTNVDAIFQRNHQPYCGSKRYRCVFLDFSLNNGTGGWSEEGCVTKSIHPRWHGTTVECSCEHMTHFTILFDLCNSLNPVEDLFDYKNSTDEYEAPEPRIVTTISLSVSIAASVPVLVHFSWKLWKKRLVLTPRNFVRLNLIISLMMAHTAFIASQYVVEITNASGESACLATAAIFHWLMLVAFFWMGMESYRIVKATRNFLSATAEISNTPGETFLKFRLSAIFVCWVLPALFPLLCLVSHMDTSAERMFGGQIYGSRSRWCWIDPKNTGFFLGTFVIPVSLIALANMIVVLQYVIETKARRNEVMQKSRLANRQSTISLAATCGLLGGAWLSGYFLLFDCENDTVKEAFEYLFIALNASQGVFILIVYSRNPRSSFLKFSLPKFATKKNYSVQAAISSYVAGSEFRLLQTLHLGKARSTGHVTPLALKYSLTDIPKPTDATDNTHS